MKEIKLGDVTPTRDFNYVKDICHDFMLLANCKKAVGETVNIGSNTEIYIKDLFELIKEIMHCDANLTLDDQRLRPEHSEVFRLRCDNTKIKGLTGYESQYTLREGLEKTVEWFTNPRNLAKYKPEIYNI